MIDKLRLIQSFLRRQTTLVLATADADGRPRSTPLFFLAGDDLCLYWFSSRTSLHGRNCAFNPRASVAIFRNTRKWKQIRGVQMDGLVSVVSDRAIRKELTGTYCARFALDNSFAPVLRRSALYCFTPAWVRYLDNAQKFGFRFELKPEVPKTR